MPWAEEGEGGIRDPFNDITALVSCTQRERAAGMMSLAGCGNGADRDFSINSDTFNSYNGWMDSGIW